MISALIAGVICAVAIFAVSRSVSNKRKTLEKDNDGAILFSMVPVDPVRVQVAELRVALHVDGPMPGYGIARPTVVADEDRVRLYMGSDESTCFLTIPTKCVVSVARGMTKLVIGKVPSIKLKLMIEDRQYSLDLPVAHPKNATAYASSTVIDPLVARLDQLVVDLK